MAISDTARDFWDRISPRERYLVIIAAIAVPITVALWLGFAIRDGLTAMEKRNEDTRAMLQTVDEIRRKGGPSKTPADEVKIPAEPLLLETYLNDAATVAGFTIKNITPRTSVPPKNGILTTTVFFQLEQLEIDALKTFLQEVETKSKVVAITRLKVKRSFKDKKKIDVPVVEVSTYSRPASGEKKDGDKPAGGSDGSAQKGG
ncbi:MAG: type II secretion system protein M [Deltaproteobacteria bacterium]|nr:type II secretion system protein M [Deltaproteobacteria bacterium]MCW5802416.1 type II secretion system protein M [Deltaproteobacteria bacterium]